MSSAPSVNPQEEIDAVLERRIEAARIAMTAAESMEDRRDWCLEMRWLISQRSQQQRDRMADAKGLPR